MRPENENAVKDGLNTISGIWFEITQNLMQDPEYRSEHDTPEVESIIQENLIEAEMCSEHGQEDARVDDIKEIVLDYINDIGDALKLSPGYYASVLEALKKYTPEENPHQYTDETIKRFLAKSFMEAYFKSQTQSCGGNIGFKMPKHPYETAKPL